MEKWYKKVYRRQLTDMHINDDRKEYLSKFNVKEYFNNLKKAKIQSPMIYLQSHTGLCNFPSKVAKTHNAMTGENNKLKQLISLCKKEKMKVVGYYSLIFNNLAADMHPKWEMVNADKTTWRDKGQRYGLCCPNNKEYRKFVVENVKELAEYFDNLDGIFYDMPYWEVLCHCDECKKRYRLETGKELPEKVDFSDENFLLYLKKRQEWMVDFSNFVKDTSYKIMPKTTCELNFAAVIGCDYMAGSTEGINDCSEFTGGDLYGDLYNHSFTSKYYYGITKNQPFEYMTCRCNKNLREHTITKPQQTLDTEILLTCAHHGATLNIDAINPDGTLDQRVYEKVGKAFSKQIPYEKYMDKGKLHSLVAVYFDSKTQFKDDITKTYNKLCAISAHKTLVENHIPVSIIANGNLNNLNDYQMIIAPSLQNFDNDEPLKFIEYVKNGGTLYLSGKSEKRLIKEFFGGEFSGYTFGNSVYSHVEKGYNEVQAYVYPLENYKEILSEFNEKYPLPITYKLPIFNGVNGDIKAKIILPYTDPDNNREYASIHSNPPEKITDYPAIIEKKFGKGKVIWSLPLLENDERINFKEIFIKIVKKNIKQKYQIKTKKTVESVIFEEGGKTYISLVDINPTFEHEDIKFDIMLKDKKKVYNITTKKTYKTNKYSDTFNTFCMMEIE